MKTSYFVRETVTNLRRNLLMTVAAITTVTVSLFLLGAVLVGGEIIDNMVGEWEDKVELSVFLRDEITPAESKDLGAAISGMPEVQKVTYVSKQGAYKEFKETFKDTPSLWENVDENALPANYRIKVHNPNTAEAVASRIEGRPGVEEVKFGGEAVRRLLRVTNLLRTISLVGISLLVLAAVTLIANTIRLAIYARRNEIGIMKLVGATNWFIRVPFILEGVIQAAVGAVVAGLAIFSVKVFLLDKLQRSVLFLPITLSYGSVVKIFAIMLGVGALIGAIGSSLALRRFLEV